MRRMSSPMPGALAAALMEAGLDIVSGGTDNHLMLVDLRPKQATGSMPKVLDRASITCNKLGIPFDPEKPFVTSGIRLGTPAGTTRGFGEAEFREVGAMIAEVVDGLRKNGEAGDGQIEQSVAGRVRDLCARFPIYPQARSLVPRRGRPSSRASRSGCWGLPLVEPSTVVDAG